MLTSTLSQTSKGMKVIMLFFYAIAVLFCACKEKTQKINDDQIEVVEPIDVIVNDTVIQSVALDYDSTKWQEIFTDSLFIIDLKYATEDNFTKQLIYPCERCFLRPVVADLMYTIAQKVKKERDFKLILFDCYRPRPMQSKLWEIVPNPIYVTHPADGSMHNRGTAVDLSFVDANGNLIDMGSDFDHFGRESHHVYSALPDSTLQRRKYLKSLMESYGFKSINSEWWHYSLSGTGSPLSDWVWPCD